jgi:broad specificity phosphatase PhoE
MKIFFVRHGQTDFNKEGRVQGQEIDMPLNAKGVEQVEKAMSFLPENIDMIISSPLKRALQTAEIADKKIKRGIQLSDDIKEMSYGSLAGKTWKDIECETGDSAMHEKDTNITFDYRPYGGEPADEFKKRIARFIDKLTSEHQNKVVLVAAHGGVIDAMHILFPQKERSETDNATIHEFDI